MDPAIRKRILEQCKVIADKLADMSEPTPEQAAEWYRERERYALRIQSPSRILQHPQERT
jgi:hypothetical protein